MRIFNAHCHIIDPRFPLVSNAVALYRLASARGQAWLDALRYRASALMLVDKDSTYEHA